MRVWRSLALAACLPITMVVLVAASALPVLGCLVIVALR